MRRFVFLFLVLHLAVLAARAAPAPHQPKIEGRVSTVSRRDIQEVIVLAQRDMRHEFGRVIPIDRIKVQDRNHLFVVYSHERHGYWVPMKRVRGVWTPPPPGIYVTTGALLQ
jgi:hypothetical protein